MDPLQKISQIFDDGVADEKSKPQLKRTPAFVLSIAFLAIVTGSFTYSYLNQAVARMSILGVLGSLKYVIPAAGVVAFDLGAIFWSVVWRNNSANGDQDMIARAMFIADVAGMSLTTLAHFVDPSVMPAILHDLTPFIVAGILIANVVAYVEYENKAHAVNLARKYRADKATLDAQRLSAEIELERQEASLASQIDAAQKAIRLAKMQEQLNELRLQARAVQGAQELMNGDVGTMQAAHDALKGGMREKFGRWVGTARANLSGNSAPVDEPEKVVVESPKPSTNGNGNRPN